MREVKRITDDDIDFINVKMSPLIYKEFMNYIADKNKIKVHIDYAKEYIDKAKRED